MKTGLCGIIASSKTRVRCTICGVFIPKATKCIEQHTNGAKHKENIDLMNEHAITFTSSALYCKPCKKSLPNEESVVMHIESEDHSNWAAAIDDLVDGEFITIDAYLSCEKDDVYCEVCKININCTLQNIEEHVNNINHRSNLTEHLKPLNGIFSSDNNEMAWCKVCLVSIGNNIRSILSHVDEDDKHVGWLTEVGDLIEDQDVTIEDFLANENQKNAYCSKCQIEIPCTRQTIESHVLGQGHLNKFVL